MDMTAGLYDREVDRLDYECTVAKLLLHKYIFCNCHHTAHAAI